ncbi:P-loop containing nucleoside triphosphate hydrolase protein [Mollisia scopiformis]|uniref:p-loop containing nucleoside triphosphate hydrolase protein n=1 Tax=Mollisia scopiformis TaxID=149040 RepID=A0A194XQU2_MOLSC|nr:P-loop containing nucleoside triphosphate hydrolase protein [Mollisia scopiformis]KUJ22548.1 P-loop containing nucleoside triphosphate hydrolase protein [Mollisia scopiformis]
MEKATLDTDATIKADHDLSSESSKMDDGNEKEHSDAVITKAEEDDPTTDYSSKAANKTSMKDYLRIFTYSTFWDRVLLAVASAAEIATGVTLPLMNIIFGNLVGSFSTLYIVYIFIARWVFSYISIFAFRMVGLRCSARLRLDFLKALFALPVSTLDTLPSGQASNTLTNTANVLQIGISEKLGTVLQFSTLMIASVAIAFKYSWQLTLVTSSVLIFVGLVYGTVIPIVVKLTKEVDHADAKAASIAGEVLGSIRMVVACGAEGRIAKRYAGWIQESNRRGIKKSPALGIQFAPLFFSVYATMALAFWFGFKLYLEHHIKNVGSIVIVLMSVMMIAFSLSQTAAPIIAISQAAGAAADFFAVIDAPKPDITGLKDPDVSAVSEIVFDGITFAYPSRPHVKVLDNLNLRFEPGKITAIVGASGSGKSTIVGLLERWYELDVEKRYVLPESVVKDKKKTEEQIEKEEEEKKLQALERPKTPIALSGSILIGGQNLDGIDLKWWRSQIGLVQQEPFVFNDTIFNNVEFGLIGSPWEHADAETKKKLVQEACKEAYADEYISRLPLGYETQVGDAGIKLSGGQRQRLAIARSIVKRPKILILDEATSAIDVRGERLVQAALDKVSEGRTTITIAHRLSTIKKADKIIVLRKGKLIEEGTHNSLLADEDGAYYALVNAQKLTMGDDFAGESDLNEDSVDNIQRILSTASGKDKHIEVTTTYKPKGFLGSFGLLLREQTRLWPWYLVLAIGCAGGGQAYAVQAYIFSNLINVITYTGSALSAASNHWSLMFFILALGTGLSYFILGHSSNVISTKISCTYRQQYFECILEKPIPFFDDEDNSSGTLTARVSNDPTQLQQMLGMNMAMVVVAVLGLSGCIIIAFVFGWKLSLLAVFVTMPIMLGTGYFRIRYEIQFEAMNQAVFAESSKFAAESIGAFRTVLSLTMEDMICNRYDVLLQGHVKKAFHKAKWTTTVFSFSDSLQLLCMALAFWYGGQLLAKQEYTPVQFFVIYMAVVQGAESAGTLLSFGPNMAQAGAAANRILSFRVKDDVSSKDLQQLEDTDGGVKIELKDLWFKYPTRDIPIFTGLNLTIEKGQFAALVGPSGCGKTSIVSLLERFYDVQRGKILVNGTDITSLNVQDYRKCMSLVAQEPTLFQGTIKENILLGVSESTPTETLYAACRDAEIHDFIMSLPDGYHTDVGNRGVNLSGGQKQRIAIARALIRDPKILLLDEATSSLDSESEKLVQAAFERAASGRTMVVVAHRLATVQNADVIFVLGEGGVLETGNHAQLLKKRGVYYQMCQSQALDR